ncbi:FAD/NAD(P)-binding protein [Glutamicibacter sp. MNS18]|uniref:FAD/NAD(P)-binding protein n=1 Tax=Glutamicibacter sp. MNS18 TaxID=2989817 RepID=UPI002235F4D8|nr:FAD/NAD(P)-binding domain-containing protein [Glutamicibacter sp. MNS18]MCW4466771.1 FAD/NAD(P)-binding protein [Glutamicibacter sp. MNS18]
MTRIAMIGGGPKCLFALLELNDALQAADAGRVHVEVYDPYPPGAGRVWNVDQPPELRLNVNSRIIDASSSLCAQTFDQWRAARANGWDKDPYPSRALVGEYLSRQFENLTGLGRLDVQHRAEVVTGVVRRGRQWEVLTAQGTRVHDEVVIATGHGLAGYRSPSAPQRSLTAAQLTVEYNGCGMDEVPPGSSVLIRGAALTAYDVILRLTEGRGGTWEQLSEEGTAALRYLPGGREPARITMVSRTGIPMNPKPHAVPSGLDEVLDEYRLRVCSWGAANQVPNPAHTATPTADLQGLWKILLDCAVSCTGTCGIKASPSELWSTVQNGESVAMAAMTSPAERLRAALQANWSREAATPEWVWGIVWSGLYAQLVPALSRITWSDADRERFRHRAAHLERMAFGPPEPTAHKLLALFEAGILQQAVTTEANEAQAITIDAVTAPAGVLRAPAPDGEAASPLIHGLLEDGEILVRRAERGLLTDTDGTCLNARGERNEGLVALGRPTEDPTLGHDTLNRSLHPEYRRWAKRVALEISSASQKVAR